MDLIISSKVVNGREGEDLHISLNIMNIILIGIRCENN